jgi:hypothetical protein
MDLFAIAWDRLFGGIWVIVVSGGRVDRISGNCSSGYVFSTDSFPFSVDEFLELSHPELAE